MVGDLHGDYPTLLRLLKICNPAKDCLIFLGDYADRGSFGVEVIETVSCLALEYPKNVFLLKGNHEDYTNRGIPTFFPSNLREEVESKRGPWENYFQNIIKLFLSQLVLAVVLGAANAYLGLKAGMTIAATYPAAVIGMALIKIMKGTILEENFTRTVGSIGESIAAGAI